MTWELAGPGTNSLSAGPSGFRAATIHAGRTFEPLTDFELPACKGSELQNVEGTFRGVHVLPAVRKKKAYAVPNA